MSDYRTKETDWQAEPLSEWLSAQIQCVLDGELTELPFAIALPVAKTSRCVFCLEPIADFQLHSGEMCGAPLRTDAHGIMRALVTSPHVCDEMKEGEDDDLFMAGLEEL
jgi:hypothetical protein